MNYERWERMTVALTPEDQDIWQTLIWRRGRGLWEVSARGDAADAADIFSHLEGAPLSVSLAVQFPSTT